MIPGSGFGGSSTRRASAPCQVRCRAVACQVPPLGIRCPPILGTLALRRFRSRCFDGDSEFPARVCDLADDRRSIFTPGRRICVLLLLNWLTFRSDGGWQAAWCWIGGRSPGGTVVPGLLDAGSLTCLRFLASLPGGRVGECAEVVQKPGEQASELCCFLVMAGGSVSSSWLVREGPGDSARAKGRILCLR